MQAMYKVEDPIEIPFYQMETGQEFVIAVNSPFSNRQLADMGIDRKIATQEYTHANKMCNSIAADERTWVHLKRLSPGNMPGQGGAKTNSGRGALR